MNINNEQASSIVNDTNSTPQVKLRSKDLMPQTGNKFNDLFELSKNMKQIKNLTDRTTIEVEYEKNKGQCTFKPHINHNPTVNAANTILNEKKSPRSIKDLRGA
jgi:hypothetical protein